jgi:hypothetical protein
MAHCLLHAYIPKEKHNTFTATSMECIYIGYAENCKAYRLYHKHSRRVFDSQDLTFDKEIGSTSQITIEVRPPSIHSRGDSRGRNFI